MWGGGGSTHPVGCAADLLSVDYTQRMYDALKPEIPEHSIRPTSKDLPVPIKLGAVLLLLPTTCTIHKVTQTHPALSATERNNHGPISTIKTPASSKSTPCSHSVVLLISSMTMETLSCEVGAPASLHPSNAPILLNPYGTKARKP